MCNPPLPRGPAHRLAVKRWREYSEDVGARICARVEATGCHPAEAGHIEGIGWDAAMRWATLGNWGREPYATFLRNVREAHARAQVRLREEQAALAATGGTK